MAEPRRVAGVVDRVEGDVAVIVFKDPDTGDHREVYLDKKKLKRIDLKEGDDVTVEMSMMVVDEKSKTVSLTFNGVKAGDMAKKFFSYLVDGGLEDTLIENLSGQGITLGISGCDKKKLSVSFEVAKDKPVKKPVKKTAKKPVKKPAKAKKAVKKVPAKRGKRL